MQLCSRLLKLKYFHVITYMYLLLPTHMTPWDRCSHQELAETELTSNTKTTLTELKDVTLQHFSQQP